MKRLVVIAVGLLIMLSQTIYLPAAEILLNIKHLPQVDAANGIGLYQTNDKGEYVLDKNGRKIEDWGSTKICGPVSIIIAVSHLKGLTPTSQDIKDLIDWMVAKKFKNYGLGANNYYGNVTSSSQLIQIVREYYGISDVDWHSKEIKKPDDSIDTEKTHARENELVNIIALSLAGNRPVIVDTFINMDSTKPGHFLVIDGLRDANNDSDYTDDNDQLHVTDPGHSKSNPLHQTWYKISQLRSTWSGVLIIGEIINPTIPAVPYTFSSHAYLGAGDVEGGKDTDWNYSLPIRKNEFTAGETAKAIIRVENIKVKHKWFAEIWREGVKLNECAWSWNEVGAGWKTSYFWPAAKVDSTGRHQFRIYLYLGDDNRRENIINLNFTVVKPEVMRPRPPAGVRIVPPKISGKFKNEQRNNLVENFHEGFF